MPDQETSKGKEGAQHISSVVWDDGVPMSLDQTLMTLQASTVYDELGIADWYDQGVRAGWFPHPLVLPYVLTLIGDLQGHMVCDLACGQGIVSRALARRGASVLGIDLSASMLALAMQYEEREPLGITYLQRDAQQLPGIPDETFDGVVCNLALMDIPDLLSTFQAVYRVLRPRGWFVFSVIHPCYQTPSSTWLKLPDGTAHAVVSKYFEEGLWRSGNGKEISGRLGSYHRMLETYLNTLAVTGLFVERMVEPRVTRETLKWLPEYREAADFDELVERKAAYGHIPGFLICRSCKLPIAW